MRLEIDGEEIEVELINDEHLGDNEDGDWEVRMYFEDYLAVTYVTAGLADRALELATEKMSHLLSVDFPYEVAVELKGVYA